MLKTLIERKIKSKFGPFYTALFEEADEGGLVVYFPALNHLSTQGEDMDEALFMAKDALDLYLEDFEGKEFPKETGEIIQTFKINLQKDF